MDYKEKYEEAMEVMRQWIAPCHTKEQLETLKKSVFPELNETEDERIRKELIFFLKEEIPQCSIKEHADKLNQFVSYLEKQKPAQNDNDDEVKTLKIKEGHWYACVNDVYLDGKRVYSKGDIVKANKFMATLDERSAAYSFRPVFFPYRQPEEFFNDLQYLAKKKHPDGCFTCDEHKKGYEAGRLNGFTAGYNKAMKEQNSAEWNKATINGEPIPTENHSVNIQLTAWSEEDEKKRNGLIKGLENRMGFGWASDPYNREEYIDWLKSLHSKPGYDKKA